MKVSYLAVSSFSLRAVLGSPGGLRGPQDEISEAGNSTAGHYLHTSEPSADQAPTGNLSYLEDANVSGDVALQASYVPLPAGVCALVPWLPLCQGSPHSQPPMPPQWHARGCAQYGCEGYVASHHCQCNDVCSHYGNCCFDYANTCKDTPPAPPSNSASPPQNTQPVQPLPPAPAPPLPSNSASTPQNTPPTQPPLPTPAPLPPSSSAPTSQNIMTLYHTTSPKIAELILKSSFRPGHSGWCGGAIYFYTSPHLPEPKLGPDSHAGAVIEARVNMGRMAHLDSKCDGAAEAKLHYDSITFNPGDGAEYLVWSSDRVISMKRYS